MKTRMLLVACALVLMALPAAAQNNSTVTESEYYYVNVPLEKVYPYRKGYVVSYRKGVSEIARAYLPLEWFDGVGGKGELIRLGPGTTWPSLTVYYKEGEFSHVRLYVRREAAHESWGNIPQTTNLDEYFENVEDLRLEF
jgi:hypothetical protein